MASVYPASLDSFSTSRVDATLMATTHAADHNNYADAINKIETELGPNTGHFPSGLNIAGTLGIGTAPGGTALVIVNNSDRTSILLQGYSAQTANFIQIRTSALQDRFRVSNIGEVYSIKATGTDLAFIAHIQGDTEIRWGVEANGDMFWGDGTNAPDVRVYRSAANVLSFAEGDNLGFGTTTGSKIGTATTQKMGFYNATPIVQPSSTGTATGFTAGAGTAVNDASTFTGAVGATAYRISDIVKHLKNLGLIAS